MKLSDYLVEQIHHLTGTAKYFGYIGGMCAHIVDSIYTNPKTELINMVTEQGAGFAAEGYARSTNKLGIAIATSGPGATNLVTPIANCWFDSTPVLFITGQVNSYEYEKYDIKQNGFQETNIVNIVKPITKYAYTIKDPNEIREQIEKAIHIALTGRKGPVLLDIPMDIQRAEINPSKLKKFISEEKEYKFNFDISLLKQAKKPLILVGNGCCLADARAELAEFLNKNQIPVIESLAGCDTVLYDYPYNMGLIGTYGNRYGNLAFYESDLLLVLGSRLDIRQTGSDTKFLDDKKIIHIDIDTKEINCNKFNKIGINCDVKNFLKYLNCQNIDLDISKWQERCLELKQTYSNNKKIYKLPNLILDSIFSELKENDIMVADVGQNQIWAAQSLKIKQGQRFISSAGLGCMGFSLPAAIGTAITGKRVFAISGDGGFQMNIQELEIIKRRNLPIKIIILNNKNLGMVRAFQELYFEGRCPSTVEDYSVPNFEKIAEAYGINSHTIEANKFDIEKIKPILNSPKAELINILFEQGTQIEPRILFGNAINNADPKIK